MFVSDHGDMLYDHNMVAKAADFNGSARVSFMIRIPKLGYGVSCNHVDEPVELRDILPTILDAVGIDIPDSIDERSVLPLFAELETRIIG